MNESRARLLVRILERLERLEEKFVALDRELAELRAQEEEEELAVWEDIDVFASACLLCGGDHDTHEHLELEVTGKLN